MDLLEVKVMLTDVNVVAIVGVGLTWVAQSVK